jgi:hypothetical protein
MSGRINVITAQSYVRPIDGDPDNEGYEIRLTYFELKNKVIATYDGFILR